MQKLWLALFFTLSFNGYAGTTGSLKLHSKDIVPFEQRLRNARNAVGAFHVKQPNHSLEDLIDFFGSRREIPNRILYQAWLLNSPSESEKIRRLDLLAGRIEVRMDQLQKTRKVNDIPAAELVELANLFEAIATEAVGNPLNPSPIAIEHAQGILNREMFNRFADTVIVDYLRKIIERRNPDLIEELSKVAI